MITGDHAVTAAAIGRQLGLRPTALTGDVIETLDDAALRAARRDDTMCSRAPARSTSCA
jgi:magnesium-transporting ATPase (P-type)